MHFKSITLANALLNHMKRFVAKEGKIPADRKSTGTATKPEHSHKQAPENANPQYTPLAEAAATTWATDGLAPNI